MIIQILASYKNVWSGVYGGGILFISIATSCHELSVLFLLLKIESLVSFDLIRRELILETLETIEEMLKILFL